jgi:hypothetical protein
MTKFVRAITFAFAPAMSTAHRNTEVHAKAVSTNGLTRKMQPRLTHCLGRQAPWRLR